MALQITEKKGENIFFLLDRCMLSVFILYFIYGGTNISYKSNPSKKRNVPSQLTNIETSERAAVCNILFYYFSRQICFEIVLQLYLPFPMNGKFEFRSPNEKKNYFILQIEIEIEKNMKLFLPVCNNDS